jgi:CheY-like chemotaxis protein
VADPITVVFRHQVLSGRSQEAETAPTILVVDDSPLLRNLINRVLTRGGYRVREAEDGVQALAEITVEPPALVLSDLLLPGMRGDELVAHIMQSRDPIPCILMSGYHTLSLPHDVPFLGKPFEPTALLHLVAEALQERRSDRAAG